MTYSDMELVGQLSVDKAREAMRTHATIELFGLEYKVAEVHTEERNFSPMVKGCAKLVCITRQSGL